MTVDSRLEVHKQMVCYLRATDAERPGAGAETFICDIHHSAVIAGCLVINHEVTMKPPQRVDLTPGKLWLRHMATLLSEGAYERVNLPSQILCSKE